MTGSLFDSLRTFYRVHRSRLFSAPDYRRDNPDIGRYPATIHYLRHGGDHGRRTGQSPLAEWLLPSLIRGDISPLQATRLAEDPMNLQVVRTLGLNVSDYEFLEAWSRLDTATARRAARRASPRMALRAAHTFADARNDLSLADAALDIVQACLAELSAAELRHALDLATARGHQVEDIGRALLSKLQGRPVTPDYQAFGLRLPLTPTSASGDIARKLVSLGLSIPTGQTPRERELSALPESVRTLFTLATHHALGGTPQVFHPGPSTIGDLSDNSLRSAVRIRLLMPGYWVSPQRDHAVTGGALRVQQAFLNACLRDGLPILPVFATPIYDITDEATHGLPTFSYHTLTRNADSQVLHVKEGYLPGHFLWDQRGYSGWSSLADATSDTIPDAPRHAARKLRETLFDIFATSNHSKYEQIGKASDLPPTPYVFAALQMPGDTVATLADLPRDIWLPALLGATRARGLALVIKRHPKDRSPITTRILDTLSAQGAYISEAPIHDAIAGSACVVTVNSGVGFEALLHPRSVMTLGGSDYRAATLPAFTVDDIPTQLDRALANPGEQARKAEALLWNIVKRRTWIDPAVP